MRKYALSKTGLQWAAPIILIWGIAMIVSLIIGDAGFAFTASIILWPLATAIYVAAWGIDSLKNFMRRPSRSNRTKSSGSQGAPTPTSHTTTQRTRTRVWARQTPSPRLEWDSRYAKPLAVAVLIGAGFFFLTVLFSWAAYDYQYTRYEQDIVNVPYPPSIPRSILLGAAFAGFLILIAVVMFSAVLNARADKTNLARTLFHRIGAGNTIIGVIFTMVWIAASVIYWGSVGSGEWPGYLKVGLYLLMTAVIFLIPQIAFRKPEERVVISAEGGPGTPDTSASGGPKSP